MKRFCLLALVILYSIVFYGVVKESQEAFAHGWTNSDPFSTLRTLKELAK